MKTFLIFFITLISTFAYAIDEKDCEEIVLAPEIQSLKTAINSGNLSPYDGLERLKVLSEDQVKSMQLDIDKMRAMLIIKREQTLEQYSAIIEADPAKQKAINDFMNIDWTDENMSQDSLRAQEVTLADNLDKAFGGVDFRLNAFYHLGDASKNIRPKKSNVDNDLAPMIGCNCTYSSDCSYGWRCGYGMYCSLTYQCGPWYTYACVDRCM